MRKSVLAGLLVLAFSKTSLAIPPDGYAFVGYGEGLVAAQRADKPLFVYFGRHGCSACLKTNAESFSDAQVRDLYSGHYILVYVDTEGAGRIRLPSGERLTEMQFAASLRLLGTPQFLYAAPDGTPLLRVPGFRTAAEFRDYHRYIAGEHYQRVSLNEFLKTLDQD